MSNLLDSLNITENKIGDFMKKKKNYEILMEN